MEMEKLSYLINDTRCLAAIEDIENGMNSLKWLGQNLDLYLNISVKADGLPRIVNANYMGTHYEGISKFFSLYEKTQSELDAPF
jgi:hypothetical protein